MRLTKNVVKGLNELYKIYAYWGGVIVFTVQCSTILHVQPNP